MNQINIHNCFWELWELIILSHEKQVIFSNRQKIQTKLKKIRQVKNIEFLIDHSTLSPRAEIHEIHEIHEIY
jgi:hypothetical protein